MTLMHFKTANFTESGVPAKQMLLGIFGVSFVLPTPVSGTRWPYWGQWVGNNVGGRVDLGGPGTKQVVGRNAGECCSKSNRW